MRQFAGALLAGAILLGLTACGTPADPDKAQESIQVIAMDTSMVFTAYGVNSTKAVYAMEDEVRRLESLLSRTDENSAVSWLNSGEEVSVGQEVCGLIDMAASYTEATGGTFDISIAPVVAAWGFTTDTYRVPDPAELTEALSRVGMEHVHLLEENGTLSAARLDPGTEIDLGGIAKGYASDRAADLFREYEIPRGLAILGGNILAWGGRPDGTPWSVGIQDPADPQNNSALAGILRLTDAYAVTSGSYQRYFTENGKTYHHIIDPATGYPADSGLTSVTVVADAAEGNGTMCDALSTALFVMGEERALDFWRSGVYDIQLVLVTTDGRVVITDGLKDRFEEFGESGYTYEVVS